MSFIPGAARPNKPNPPNPEIPCWGRGGVVPFFDFPLFECLLNREVGSGMMDLSMDMCDSVGRLTIGGGVIEGGEASGVAATGGCGGS